MHTLNIYAAILLFTFFSLNYGTLVIGLVMKKLLYYEIKNKSYVLSQRLNIRVSQFD